jgi:hypothetical protein
MLRYLPTLLFACLACVSYGQSYNYYYGNIHAHTSYSDGSRDEATTGVSVPGQAYTYAKQSYNFNFLGISEHNHSGAGMHVADYAKGVFQADTANKNGQFVCLYGMEYGVINNGGHVVIYGIDSLVGWETNNYQIFCGEFDYSTLWKLIARRPRAFATLAHPADNAFANLANTAYIDTADIAVVGVPIRSGAAFSTTTDYSDAPPATVYDVYWRKLLAKGYHVGASIDHDNHYTTFGRTAHSRTVVLAGSLNRDTIMDAYRKRRFYASDDWNVQVNFTINAYPLGSVFNTVTNPSINIQVTDADAGDNVSSIQVYYGVPGSGVLSTLLTSSTTNNLSYTHAINLNDRYYYYAVITQADGNMIWTSPIWVQKTDVAMPLTVLNFAGKVVGKAIRLQAGFITNEPYSNITIEKGYKGYDFKPIAILDAASLTKNSIDYTDNDPAEGYQYYRLKMQDKTGAFSYSNTLAVAYHNADYRIRAAASGTSAIAVRFTSPVAMGATISLYNQQGRLVGIKHVTSTAGMNTVQIPTRGLSSGMFIVVVQYANGVQRECKVVR